MCNTSYTVHMIHTATLLSTANQQNWVQKTICSYWRSNAPDDRRTCRPKGTSINYFFFILLVLHIISPNMTLNLCLNNFSLRGCFYKTLTFSSKTCKLCPVQCTPALSERENIIPSHHEVFTVFCICNNIFAILVLNASMGLKVCLNCTSD
jgi:hypothetical protein